VLIPIKVILCQRREQKNDLGLDNRMYWRLTARTGRGCVGVHVALEVFVEQN
jgi:hypothetical protein